MDVIITCWYVVLDGWLEVTAEPGKFFSTSIKLKELPKAGMLRMSLLRGAPRPRATSIRAS